MSEYQYYEFQTIDRPLNHDQQAAMRRLSSRVELTATRAAFNYSYGDFRGEPLAVLEQHFDALLYIANWGSKQLAFRFPRNAIATDQFAPYLLGDEESFLSELRTTTEHIIVNLEIREEEGYGWIEGEGLLDPLIPLRAAMLHGDMRALYLFWLRCAADQAAWVDADEDAIDTVIEPLVPPGLGEMDPALQAFAEFFAVDHDLIAAAAEASPSLTANDEPLEQWLTLLPEAERNDFLVRLARGEPHIDVALLRRLRAVAGANTSPAAGSPRRSFEELQAAAKRQAQLRRQHERAAAEQARLAKLATLAQREAEIWASIPALLAKRNASGYDEGIARLVDLRDLAVHRGQQAAFADRLAEVIAPYAASPAVQRRLKAHQLLP